VLTKKADGTTGWAAAQGGAGSIIIEGADQTPFYVNPTNLRFDEADGFALSEPVAGIAQIDLANVPNGALANSQVTINGTANRITGGGAVALGGALTLNIDPTLFPQPGAGDANKFYKVTGANAGSFALLADADIPDSITITNITQITNRSHTSLSDIGTNTHAQIDSHIASMANPHSVTKAQVGLGNVDNTSDLNKPISTATQAALDLKAPLASPVFTGQPTIPDFTLAGHNHSNAAGGGQLHLRRCKAMGRRYSSSAAAPSPPMTASSLMRAAISFLLARHAERAAAEAGCRETLPGTPTR
jgi:hypothetical protein